MPTGFRSRRSRGTGYHVRFAVVAANQVEADVAGRNLWRLHRRGLITVSVSVLTLLRLFVVAVVDADVGLHDGVIVAFFSVVVLEALIFVLFVDSYGEVDDRVIIVGIGRRRLSFACAERAFVHERLPTNRTGALSGRVYLLIIALGIIRGSWKKRKRERNDR